MEANKYENSSSLRYNVHRPVSRVFSLKRLWQKIDSAIMPASNSSYSPPDDRDNKIILQSYEWNTPSVPPTGRETHSPGSHYALLTKILPSLAAVGLTTVWLPPGCKAMSPKGNGYDCYDLWDLGEFEQKGARSTKWGSREELVDLMAAADKLGVECVWDTILNHKAGGDSTEKTWVVEVDENDRRVEICEPKKISAWLRFDFPGREKEGMKYSNLKWRAEHFSGTDWDDETAKKAIYKIIDDPSQPLPPSATSSRSAEKMWNKLKDSFTPPRVRSPKRYDAHSTRPGKGWTTDVSAEFGNFDFLMFSNIYYRNEEACRDVFRWGEWMVLGEDADNNGISVQGFRIDAAHHISRAFLREWIQKVNAVSWRRRNTPLFIVVELWTGDVARIEEWLKALFRRPSDPDPPPIYAFDAPLLYNFSHLSQGVLHGRMDNSAPHPDLRQILQGSLAASNPVAAVTIVTNHDTQPGSTVETHMAREFKTLWYAFILLRAEGSPCVFWGDLFGIHGEHAEPPACQVPGRPKLTDDMNPPLRMRSLLPDLMLCRTLFAYGLQVEYLHSETCIGWTRQGSKSRSPPSSGCAVVLSIADESALETVQMAIGRPGDTYVNLLLLEKDRLASEVVIDHAGMGNFTCAGSTAAVFVRRDDEALGRFPVEFDVALYD